MNRERETEVLRRLLALLLESESPDGDLAPGFPAAFERSARVTYFLLHRAPDASSDARTFVTETLERLLQQLSARTVRRTVELRGRVRGRISWPATFTSRWSGDHDPSRFVCREAHRHFDTPENQLLRFVVEALWRALREVPEVMRAGAAYFPASGRFAPTVVGDELVRLELDLARLRRHVRLRSVSLPERIGPAHLLAAETSKLGEYALAATLYRSYRDAVLEPRPEALRRLGASGLPLPGDAGAQAEPWLRLAAAVVRAPRITGQTASRTAGSPRIT